MNNRANPDQSLKLQWISPGFVKAPSLPIGVTYLAETQAAFVDFSTTGRFEMSFLPAISIIALLAMLPVLISLRASMVEGARISQPPAPSQRRQRCF
ncbi:hypothetical protein ACU4I5_14525 [Ensifer adhaerens]